MAGSAGKGGVTETGGAQSGGAAAGGAATGGAGAGSGGTGAMQATGGVAPSGGSPGQGGLSSSGGKSGTGGAAASGGAVASGGIPNAGGASAKGGTTGFGGTVATSGSGGGASGGISTTAGTSGKGGTTGSGGTVATGGTAAAGLVQMVDAAHVRLLSGSPFYDRQELHRKGILAQLDTDKLLYAYRSFAKVSQANGAAGGYAGWDTGFLVGHMLGHYLSAASRMAAATGDTSFTTKVNYVVGELAKCQTALGSGYLAAFPTAVFDWVEGKSGASNGGIVVPYYIVHKIMAGLLDANHYTGNQQALDVVTKMADYFQGRLAALPAATIEKTFRTDGNGNPQNEFGAMSDVLAQLSEVTGQKKYLDTAKIFNRSWFITPLAAGQDNLQGLHGNTHIAQALGIAHTANLSGDTASLQASEN
ncbi:MAG TPA: beta-L-arabinofuranosidase domain-containing protein, partial [Polyangia bacterium]